MHKITICGETKEYKDGITYLELAKEYQDRYPETIALAAIGNRIQELHKVVDRDCEVSFLTLADSAGHKAYVRTATMMLMKAVEDELSDIRPDQVKVEFAIGNGYYISMKGHLVTQVEIKSLEAAMRKMQQDALPIEKRAVPKDEAIRLFEKTNMSDKVKLFRYRRSSSVNVYSLL